MSYLDRQSIVVTCAREAAGVTAVVNNTGMSGDGSVELPDTLGFALRFVPRFALFAPPLLLPPPPPVDGADVADVGVGPLLYRGVMGGVLLRRRGRPAGLS